jgi:hypothetical protein
MLRTEVQVETRHTGRLVHENVDFIVCGKNLGMTNLVQINYQLQYNNNNNNNNNNRV